MDRIVIQHGIRAKLKVLGLNPTIIHLKNLQVTRLSNNRHAREGRAGIIKLNDTPMYYAVTNS